MLLVAIFVCMAPLAAQIKVVSPNGGEILTLEQHWSIGWTAINVKQQVRIVLLKEGGAKFGVIKEPLDPGASPYDWTIGQTDVGMAPLGKYKVRVTTLSGNNLDVSDNPFTIVDGGQPPPPGGPPSITVTSPNGGEPWEKLSTKNITWTAMNFDGAVDLILKKNDIIIGTIASKLPAKQGFHPWPVGNLLDGKTAGYGGGYKVRVVKSWEGMFHQKLIQLADESDNAFSIKFISSPDDKRKALANIEMLYPKEGEVYHYGMAGEPVEEGTEVSISWRTDCTGPYQIILCNSNGNTIKSLKVVDKKGALIQFTPKEMPKGTYRIRVQAANGLCSGISGRFSMKYMIYLGEKKPDLIVCKIDPTIIKAQGNAPVTAYIRIYVKNIGTAAANECTLRYTFQNGPSGEHQVIPLPPLHDGGATQIDMYGAFNGGGPWNYTLFVDCLGVVSEINDNNNILDGTIPNKGPEESYKCSDEDQ